MKRLILVVLALTCAYLPLTAGTAVVPDATVFEAVLQEYVLDDGRVRYGALRRNLAPLEGFVQQMGVVSPHSHPQLFSNREARLAYWINAYNAFVLWAFAKEYPEKRDRLSGLLGRGSFFYLKKFEVGGKSLSLAAIENDVIREEFAEPRIHFALVCASAGCPWLARKAYTAGTLEEMLEGEAKRFLNQKRNVAVDGRRRVITVSKLMDWYAKDFGASKREVLAYVSRYRPDLASALGSGTWTLKYFDYDWSANDASEPAT